MGSKKVTLKSSDGQIFEVEEAVALKSQTLKHMIEDDCADGVIPLPNVTSNILSKVIEYCKKHVEMQKLGKDNEVLDEDLKCWVANFVKVNELSTVYDLFMAANYLDIKSLLNLTYQVVADMITGKIPGGRLFMEEASRLERWQEQLPQQLLRQLLQLPQLPQQQRQQLQLLQLPLQQQLPPQQHQQEQQQQLQPPPPPPPPLQLLLLQLRQPLQLRQRQRQLLQPLQWQRLQPLQWQRLQLLQPPQRLQLLQPPQLLPLLQWFLMKEARKIAVQGMEESFLALEQARLMEEEERRRLMEERFNDLEQVFLEQERDLMFDALEQEEDEKERWQRFLMEERFLALEQAMFLAFEQFNEEEEDEGLFAIIYF